MKYFLRLLCAGILIFFGLKLLLPFHLYPIEHFEFALLKIIPISWVLVAVLSRLLVGVLFVFAFVLIFYSPKQKWLLFISVFCFAIPFLVNTVYPEQLKTTDVFISEKLSTDIENPSEDTLLLAFLSYNCLHCTQAALKLQTAQEINPNFPKIVAVSYNNKIDTFFKANQIDFPLKVISAQAFTEITAASFPKFQLVYKQNIIKKWEPEQFNYAVMDQLSK